ncbi:MAG: hypothetical protein S0880_22965 [Actinomycetota bacterium]|nr:hypothetical protein [Actinomycetota bacterium]
MARKGRERFEKRRLEQARRDRKKAKQERAEARREDEDGTGETDEAALMERFRVLSEAHAAGEIEDEDYETQRSELFAALGLEHHDHG